MKDILRRLKSVDGQLAAELIARGAFSRKDVAAVLAEIKRTKIKARERSTFYRVVAKRGMIVQAAFVFLAGGKIPGWMFHPGFVPSLAYCDRQVAIHGVINGNLTDSELAELAKLTSLQRDGHLLRQLRVAIELEQDRRKLNGRRGGGNRVATQVG